MKTAIIPIHAVLRSKRSNCCYVDIETTKVKLTTPVVMANGELLKSRWEPIAIGLGNKSRSDWWATLMFDFEGSEWVKELTDWQSDHDYFYALYGATREFDEMILKGKFTNARRAHLKTKPREWPGISPDLFCWLNLRKIQRPRHARDLDILSKNIPNAWPELKLEVLVHLYRDVVELILSDPEVEVVSGYRELEEVMTNFGYCARLVTKHL